MVLPAGARTEVSRDRLVRMRDVLTHRGPDDAGLFLEATPNGPRIGLGHRRLSIVDVAHGAQPMPSADGRFQLVYNGEVYNHPTVMKQLEAAGVQYHTHCDTETVLHLFERHGVHAPESLRGMFAFAIWDRREQSLFLCRDRFGVKPLYYHHADDGSLYFASEIKALFEYGALRPVLNLRALPDFLANHATSDETTLFEGVRRLPPGHTLTWLDGRIEIRPYWELSMRPDERLARASEADVTAEYLERFREAVRLRLMADVPLGMFLSGGIDSAAITAAMAQLVDDQIKTFSVAFAEREANELHYARLVASRYRTGHREIVVTPHEFFEALPRLVWHEDEPLAHPSSVALNFVSRLAGEHVKVVLTGEGSDETLAGYNRYRATIFQLRLGRAWEQLAPEPVRAGARALVGRLPRGRVRQRLMRTIINRPANLDALYFDNFAVFSSGEQQQLLTTALCEQLRDIDPYQPYHRAFEASQGASLLNRLLYVDAKTYLHELLMKQDQMSMAASIESRVPFLDHPLVEFAASMPDRFKLRGMTTKWVLRRAMKDLLPPEILSRKKMGFPVPVGSWFRGEWRQMVEEFVLSERAMARGIFDTQYLRSLVTAHMTGENHAERLWALVNFEIWQRVFFDGDSPQQVCATASGMTKARAGSPPATAVPA